MVRRRRRAVWAVTAAVVAALAGGYVSYRLYTSEACRRKRQQVARLLSALSLLGDAVQHGAESAALLSSDFKRFLLSDDDHLPPSLRQAFKIAHSPEFQHSCTVLSAALARGILRGTVFTAFPTHRSGDVPHCRVNNPPEDLSCKEIKEICPISTSGSPGPHKRGIHHSHADNECAWQGSETKTYMSGFKRFGLVVETDQRGPVEGKALDKLPERLLAKLFSEPGINFASAVVGNSACNIVKALFDGFHHQNAYSNTLLSCHEPSSRVPPDVVSVKDKPGSSKIIDVICTQQCRGLINECIQTLVSTSVSVYIEKTKDVNFYNDMVAGITNPSHKDPMKDMLTSVCNSAVETLVKTSHKVMFAKKQQHPRSDTSRQLPRRQEQQAVGLLSNGELVQSQLSIINVPGESHHQEIMEEDIAHHGRTLSGIIEMPQVSAISEMQHSEREFLDEMSEGPQQDTASVQSFIDGVSKTLAIPSNHKLVVDVAGTVTSEAVRSFADVVISTISGNLRDRIAGRWGRVKTVVVEQSSDMQAVQCKVKSKDVALKAFMLASICLAICLHMLTGIHLLERT